MRFMVIVKATPDTELVGTPNRDDIAAMARYNEELVKAGVAIDWDGLHPSSKGARVRFQEDGERLVLDGPFTESKELIAGYWIWQVESREEAIEWVKRIPARPGVESEIEIRQIFDAREFADDLAPDPASERPLPKVTDRATWQKRIDMLRTREKAHTRAGDALAAQRRRLPMVEVDATTKVIGPDGPVSLLDVFEGRSQLVAYFHMWHTGKPAAEQCEGCTFSTSHLNELSYLHSRDVTYATLAEGPYEEGARYHDFMGWTMPWYSVPEESVDALIAGRHFGVLASYLRDGDKVYETYWTTGRGNERMSPSYGLLDITPYGRQETWEDSPAGWPQHWGSRGGQFQQDGRPTSQWPRIRAGHDDALT